MEGLLSQIKLDIILDPYSPDNRGGVTYIGSFLAESTLMFGSGAVYCPILIKAFSDQFGLQGYLIMGILILYTLAILLSFIIPIWLMHRKIELEKGHMIQQIAKEINRLSNMNKGNDVKKNLQALLIHKKLENVKDILTWPFQLENLMMVFASIVLPIILTIYQVLATTK